MYDREGCQTRLAPTCFVITLNLKREGFSAWEGVEKCGSSGEGGREIRCTESGCEEKIVKRGWEGEPK